ncbi:hypothetical protein IC232_04640 [Microvirga sp. BT688]|uniref:hypothetical protein n=1 Tax=Microvirga sp. TaxID=1873136 RepID=UPI0016870593|nr:hypothetical protein [Microvirga sp.]MBD2745983.1 hypothetical protein [Microvirga sp.]
MHIVDVENGPSVLYDGPRLIASGSREMCEAVRDGRLADYIARCEEERKRLKIGFHSPRLQRQLALEEAQLAALPRQAELLL